jgi:hypothetical protein
LDVPALSDQLTGVAVTMSKRLGSDDVRCSTQIDYLQGEMISGTRLRPRRSSRSAPGFGCGGGGLVEPDRPVREYLFRPGLAIIGAFTSVLRRVVAFVSRDATHLAAGDVDHRRVGRVVRARQDRAWPCAVRPGPGG